MTEREAEVLAYISSHVEANGGVSPTFGEIRDGVRASSTGGVHRFINNLQRKGYLTYTPGMARSIRLDRGVSYGRLVVASEALLKAFQSGRITAGHWRRLESALPRSAV